MQTNKR